MSMNISKDTVTASGLAGVGGAAAIHFAAESATEYFSGMTVQYIKSAAAVPLASKILFSASICALALKVHEFASDLLDKTRLARIPRLKKFVCVIIDLSVCAAATYILAPVVGLTFAVAAIVNGVSLTILGVAKLLSSYVPKPPSAQEVKSNKSIKTLLHEVGGMKKKLDEMYTPAQIEALQDSDAFKQAVADAVNAKVPDVLGDVATKTQLASLSGEGDINKLLEAAINAVTEALNVKFPENLGDVATSAKLEALPTTVAFKKAVREAVRGELTPALTKVATKAQVSALPNDATFKEAMKGVVKDILTSETFNNALQSALKDTLNKIDQAVRDVVAIKNDAVDKLAKIHKKIIQDLEGFKPENLAGIEKRIEELITEYERSRIHEPFQSPELIGSPQIVADAFKHSRVDDDGVDTGKENEDAADGKSPTVGKPTHTTGVVGRTVGFLGFQRQKASRRGT